MREESEKERKYPTQEVEPENFLTNEEVKNLVKHRHMYTFKQQAYEKLYNCVHCRECGTSDERILLKQKFLRDGNKIEGLEETKRIFEEFGSPYKDAKRRMKLPTDIPQESETLLYFGCFVNVKTPKYGENAARYLLSKKVDFTVLDKETCCAYPILVTGDTETYNTLIERNRKIFKSRGFKKIITICPSCYMTFNKHYSDLGIETVYFTDYLEPSKENKTGEVSIQHACPLIYDCKPDVKEKIEKILTDSGYKIMDIPLFCCGGGVGHQLRTDVAEKIAKVRVNDYKGDFVTYYCPDCYWFIKVFGKKARIKPKVKDLFELLS
ncbi:MAG: Lactate utilization protein A [Promethearchaeota archaeon]|nr:MAG: Lactate utilization protein A [Candidatus Lokiarchaeota archaeon]